MNPPPSHDMFSSWVKVGENTNKLDLYRKEEVLLSIKPFHSCRHSYKISMNFIEGLFRTLQEERPFLGAKQEPIVHTKGPFVRASLSFEG